MKKESFSLEEVKFLKGKIITKYLNAETMANCIDTWEEKDLYPHEDFVLAIRAFDKPLQEVFFTPKNHDRHVLCNGIAIRMKSVADKGEVMSVCIKGLLITKSGSNRAISTEYIPEDGEAYSFEKNLKKMVDTIIDEAYGYITRQKFGNTAPLSMFIDPKED